MVPYTDLAPKGLAHQEDHFGESGTGENAPIGARDRLKPGADNWRLSDGGRAVSVLLSS